MAPEPEQKYHSATLRISDREKIKEYIHVRSQGAGAACSLTRKKKFGSLKRRQI